MTDVELEMIDVEFTKDVEFRREVEFADVRSVPLTSEDAIEPPEDL